MGQVKNDFSWIPFYKELAKALLIYKEDRSPLVDFIYSELSKVGDKSLVDYLHMRDGSRIKDIDPFSVYGIFNRNLKLINKIAFLQKFKDKLNLVSDVPTDFEGIPTVDARRAFFFSWSDNGERIRSLWAMLENVITGKDISQIFDYVIADGLPKYQLTMILYWVAPDKFIGLDDRNRSHLAKFGYPDSFPNLNYSEYSKLVEDIRGKMSDGTIPFSTFPEFSHKAWSLAQTERIWMYNHYEDTFARDHIRMGSSAKGMLDFSSFKSKKDLGDAYRDVVGNTDVSLPDMYWKLMNEVKVGDIVVVFDSNKHGKAFYHQLYGWGKVTSDVIYDYDDDNPIHRNVEWHLPLPNTPIKETGTKNTLYFHEVKGIEAANIIELLGINTEGGVTMNNKNIDDSIKLLKTNKNLILTGAPGTGKTYLAKEIAKKCLD